MNLKSAFALSVALLFTACMTDGPGEKGAAEPARSETPAGPGLMAPPEHLLLDGERNGIPMYTPVEFRDDMALVEGDIIIAQGAAEVEKVRAQLADPAGFRPALAKTTGFLKNDAIYGGAKAWPSGVISYELDANLGTQRAMVLQAIYEWNRDAAIRLVPWNPNQFEVRVNFRLVPGDLSSSAVGCQWMGQQQINISSKATVRTVMHEIGHAAGSYHEHQRPDRGQYVRMVTAGTDKGGFFEVNYAIPTDGTTIGSYDKTSIMHYSSTTTTFTNPDGTFYYVQVKSQTGETIPGGDKFSTTDKLAMWEVQKVEFPFMNTDLQTDADLWTVRKLYDVWNGSTTSFFFARYQSSGIVEVYPVNADGSLGGRRQALSIGSGYSRIVPFKHTSNAHYLMFYNKSTGNYVVRRVNADGTLGTQAASARLPSGLTNIQYWFHGGNHFLLTQNSTSGHADRWKVRIYRANSNGTLVSTPTYDGTMTNWQVGRPYYLENSQFIPTPYFLFRNSGTGETRLQNMNSTGTLGTTIETRTFQASSATVAVYNSGQAAFLMVITGPMVRVYEINRTGFRDSGRLQREWNYGYTIRELDAVSNLYNPAPAGNRMSKGYDMRHMIFWNLAEADYYPYLFLGQGFPFL